MPGQDRLADGEYGNAALRLVFIRRPTAVTGSTRRTFSHRMRLPSAYGPTIATPVNQRPTSGTELEFRSLDYVRPECTSGAQAGKNRSGDNLAIQVRDPRFYKCWSGCTEEEIRAALRRPIRKSAVRRLTRVVCCVGCKHTHVAVPPNSDRMRGDINV